MKKLLMSAAMLVMLASTAAAAVTFDRASGTGTADKQDLTALFGSDVVASLEAAESVNFTTQRSRVFETLCRRVGTSVTRTFRRALTRTTVVLSSVLTNPSDKPQSWTFDGYGSSIVTGSFCPSGWARVGLPDSQSVGVLRLQATFDGETKTLKLLAGASTTAAADEI